MFFIAQISFRTFGHTVTLTSPRCFPKKQHQRARLADAAADRERNLVLENCSVVGQFPDPTNNVLQEFKIASCSAVIARCQSH